ncbi:MAG: hypothetical protein AAB510_03440 [Patescibacteria group bacterium]
MEEIKKLFIKHFGFLPDIISTTEHSYVSPPSRLVSSLIQISNFTNKKVLRIIMTDSYASPLDTSMKSICLPHILNKNIFVIDLTKSKEEIISKLEEDCQFFEMILDKKNIFSKEERLNYNTIINIYRYSINSLSDIDSVSLYNKIVQKYIEIFQLVDLNKWLSNSASLGIDCLKMRVFLEQAFKILINIDPDAVDLFGKYLENNKRLKVRDINNSIKIVDWVVYKKELTNSSNSYNVISEIILYIYSYCGGSHFGNDYGVIDDINMLNINNNLVQLTKHNKDFLFKVEEKNIQFQKINLMKKNLNLSNKILKTISTLPELCIVLGEFNLRNKFIK